MDSALDCGFQGQEQAPVHKSVYNYTQDQSTKLHNRISEPKHNQKYESIPTNINVMSRWQILCKGKGGPALLSWNCFFPWAFQARAGWLAYWLSLLA